jgi:hypothetical protein
VQLDALLSEEILQLGFQQMLTALLFVLIHCLPIHWLAEICGYVESLDLVLIS